MLRVYQTSIMLAVMLVLTACQAVSTAKPYKPANCAMVGASCGRPPHLSR